MAVSPEVVVKPNDILCGRGPGVLKHPGNQAFRALVMEIAEAYASFNQEERSQVVEDILTQVEQSGGRFLRRTHADKEEKIWSIVPRANARWKIAQAFDDVLQRRFRLQDHVNNVGDGDHDSFGRVDVRKGKNHSSRRLLVVWLFIRSSIS